MPFRFQPPFNNSCNKGRSILLYIYIYSVNIMLLYSGGLQSGLPVNDPQPCFSGSLMRGCANVFFLLLDRVFDSNIAVNYKISEAIYLSLNVALRNGNTLLCLTFLAHSRSYSLIHRWSLCVSMSQKHLGSDGDNQPGLADG